VQRLLDVLADDGREGAGHVAQGARHGRVEGQDQRRLEGRGVRGEGVLEGGVVAVELGVPVAVDVLQGVAVAAPVVLGARVRRPGEVEDVRDDAAVRAAGVGVDDDLGLGVAPEVGDVQRGVVLARGVDAADRADLGVGERRAVEGRRALRAR
jgi:hypothetical protein